MNELDPKFKHEVAAQPGGEHIMRCFQCGSCSTCCTVREVTDKYNPRKIIRMILLGMRDKVLSSDFIWLCSICHNCVEHCPQDVRFSEVMDAVGNIATREGYVHPSYATRAELIGRQGVLYEVTERENQRRQELGLPPRATKFDDVGQIFDLTGLLELVRKDKEE